MVLVTIFGAINKDPRNRVPSGSEPNLVQDLSVFSNWDITWPAKKRRGSLGLEENLLLWGEPSGCPFPDDDGQPLLNLKGRFIMCVSCWHHFSPPPTHFLKASDTDTVDPEMFFKTWISPELCWACTRSISASVKNIRSPACVKYMSNWSKNP